MVFFSTKRAWPPFVAARSRISVVDVPGGGRRGTAQQKASQGKHGRQRADVSSLLLRQKSKKLNQL